VKNWGKGNYAIADRGRCRSVAGFQLEGDGAQVEQESRFGAEGLGVERGCPLPSTLGVASGEGMCKNFCIFYIKMASFRVFCLAISYRLAACFIRIGSTCGIEIYWRSLHHFGNYKLLLVENCAQK